MARQRRLTAEQGRALLIQFRGINRTLEVEHTGLQIIVPIEAANMLRILNFDQASIDLITDLYDEG